MWRESSASGTSVVLPAPGGATSTALLPVSSAASSERQRFGDGQDWQVGRFMRVGGRGLALGSSTERVGVSEFVQCRARVTGEVAGEAARRGGLRVEHRDGDWARCRKVGRAGATPIAANPPIRSI